MSYVLAHPENTQPIPLFIDGCWENEFIDHFVWQAVWDERCPELTLHLGDESSITTAEGIEEHQYRFTLIYAPRAVHEEGRRTLYEGRNAAELLDILLVWKAKVRRESHPAPPLSKFRCVGSRRHSTLPRCGRCERCRVRGWRK